MAQPDSKQITRERFIRARKALTAEDRNLRDARIRERLSRFAEFRSAGTVFFYCSREPEVDTKVLIRQSLRDLKRVVLPVSLADGLELRLIRDLDVDCVPGRFGIFEPRADTCPLVEPGEIDFFAIPGVAFDLEGRRLGWGRGYFDRFLSAVPAGGVVAGLAYEIQICPVLETAEHDMPVDVLLTESRLLDFRTKRG